MTRHLRLGVSRRAALGVVAGVAAWTPAALAHRRHAALTVVRWRLEDQFLEVTHRVFAHDIEGMMAERFPQAKVSLTTLEGRARAALIIADAFTLDALTDATGEAQPVDLNVLGAETEGDALFVFAEASFAAPPPFLRVRSMILHDYFDDQINTVNVETPAGVRTSIQAKGASAETLPFWSDAAR